jgi:hypothetical protein
MQLNDTAGLEHREQEYRRQARELLAKAERLRSEGLALSAAANEVRNAILTSRH